jgi:hypothetical protein
VVAEDRSEPKLAVELDLVGVVWKVLVGVGNILIADDDVAGLVMVDGEVVCIVPELELATEWEWVDSDYIEQWMSIKIQVDEYKTEEPTPKFAAAAAHAGTEILAVQMKWGQLEMHQETKETANQARTRTPQNFKNVRLVSPRDLNSVLTDRPKAKNSSPTKLTNLYF